jgi:hypothetical protein
MPRSAVPTRAVAATAARAGRFWRSSLLQGDKGVAPVRTELRRALGSLGQFNAGLPLPALGVEQFHG